MRRKLKPGAILRSVHSDIIVTIKFKDGYNYCIDMVVSDTVHSNVYVICTTVHDVLDFGDYRFVINGEIENEP
jgi:hypothetical protein